MSHRKHTWVPTDTTSKLCFFTGLWELQMITCLLILATSDASHSAAGFMIVLFDYIYNCTLLSHGYQTTSGSWWMEKLDINISKKIHKYFIPSRICIQCFKRSKFNILFLNYILTCTVWVKIWDLLLALHQNAKAQYEST